MSFTRELDFNLKSSWSQGDLHKKSSPDKSEELFSWQLGKGLRLNKLDLTYLSLQLNNEHTKMELAPFLESRLSQSELVEDRLSRLHRAISLSLS